MITSTSLDSSWTCVYQIQRMHGRHFFGRRLLRQYANGTATDEVYDVSFVNDEWNNMRLNEMHGEMSDMWTDVIATMRREGADLVRIHISHSDLSKGDIKVPVQSIEKITPEGIMERIEKVMQSNHDLTIDGVLEISVGIIKLPKAQGRHQHPEYHKWIIETKEESSGDWKRWYFMLAESPIRQSGLGTTSEERVVSKTVEVYMWPRETGTAWHGHNHGQSRWIRAGWLFRHEAYNQIWGTSTSEHRGGRS